MEKYTENVKGNIIWHREYTKHHYDKTARILPEVNKGDRVFIKSYPKKIWLQGSVMKKNVDNSCEVETDAGGTYRRSRIDVKAPRSDIVEENMPAADDCTPTVVPGEREARPVRERRQPGRFEEYVLY